MIIKDDEAVAELNGHNTVRDWLLVSVSFQHLSWDVPVDVAMIFKHGEAADAATVTLTFREVDEFSFLYARQTRDVGFFKCLKTPDGDFYVSLDPYDEREQFVTEKDGNVVRAKHLEMAMEGASTSLR